MSFDAHANLAYSLISVAPSPKDTGTSLSVATGEGVLYPATPFNATVWPVNTIPLTSNAEIVRVTAIVGDVFTITRAQEGTSAKQISQGWQIANTATKKTFTDIEAVAGTGTSTIDPTDLYSLEETDITPQLAVDRFDDYFSGPGVSNIFGEELTAFRAAMAKKDSSRVNILGVGDSVTTGWLASSSTARWFDVMLSYLQKSNGQAVSAGYYGASTVTTSNAYTGRLWAISGGSATNNTDVGLGYCNVTVPVGATLTSPTVMCDRITVHYPHFGVFAGGIRIRIDGGTAVNLNENTSPKKGGIIYDSGALTRGLHYVTIETQGSFSTRVEGATFYDGNFASGICGFNGGHFGYKTSQFAATGATTWWTDGFDNINPHLVLIALGINDQTAGDTPATYRANITTIINRINSVADGNSQTRPSIIVVAPFGTGADASATSPYRQAARRAALDNGVAYVDWSALLGYVGDGPSDTYSLMGDSKHPNSNGHRLIGNWMGQSLLSAAGLDPSAPDLWQKVTDDRLTPTDDIKRVYLGSDTSPVDGFMTADSALFALSASGSNAGFLFHVEANDVPNVAPAFLAIAGNGVDVDNPAASYDTQVLFRLLASGYTSDDTIGLGLGQLGALQFYVDGTVTDTELPITFDLSASKIKLNANSMEVNAPIDGGITINGELDVDDVVVHNLLTTDNLEVTNSLTSGRLQLERPDNTSFLSEVIHSTNGVDKWGIGLRGLSNEDYYIYNQSLTAAALEIDNGNNNAFFGGAISLKEYASISRTSSSGFAQSIYVTNNVTKWGTGLRSGTEDYHIFSETAVQSAIQISDSTGAVTLNQAYALPTSDGSNGYVLTTDGGGVTYFAAIPYPTPTGQKALFDHYANVGNATTTLTTLWTDTTAAGQLAANGDKLSAKYAGTFAGNATATSQIKAAFGGTVVFDSGAISVPTFAGWELNIMIIRVSSTVVRGSFVLTSQGTPLTNYSSVGELTGLTLSNTNAFVIQAQAAGAGAASGDITGKLGTVTFLPAA